MGALLHAPLGTDSKLAAKTLLDSSRPIIDDLTFAESALDAATYLLNVPYTDRSQSWRIAVEFNKVVPSYCSIRQDPGRQVPTESEHSCVRNHRYPEDIVISDIVHDNDDSLAFK